TTMVCEQLGTTLTMFPLASKVAQLRCVSAADALMDVVPKLATQASTTSSFLTCLSWVPGPLSGERRLSDRNAVERPCTWAFSVCYNVVHASGRNSRATPERQ